MAKSKLVKAHEKVVRKVTDTFGKIENHVVDGYTKIEDAFVDRYLTKDGESVEEAKRRLQQEHPAITRTKPNRNNKNLCFVARNAPNRGFCIESFLLAAQCSNPVGMEPPGSSLSRPARRPAASTKTAARGHRLAVHDGGRYPGKASFYQFAFPESTVPIRTKARLGPSKPAHRLGRVLTA